MLGDQRIADGYEVLREFPADRVQEIDNLLLVGRVRYEVFHILDYGLADGAFQALQWLWSSFRHEGVQEEQHYR